MQNITGSELPETTPCLSVVVCHIAVIRQQKVSFWFASHVIMQDQKKSGGHHCVTDPTSFSDDIWVHKVWLWHLHQPSKSFITLAINQSKQLLYNSTRLAIPPLVCRWLTLRWRRALSFASPSGRDRWEDSCPGKGLPVKLESIWNPLFTWV